MDADRQNDPHDIPVMVEKIEQGDDVVVGWRKNRKDKALTRKIPSILANWLIRKVGGVEVNDLGCSLKGFRSNLIKEVKLYGEMHRFIPLYTKLIGGRLSEVVVNHRERVAGETKYGLNRTFNVILDLITVKFFLNYGTKPMYFFGKIGLFFLFLSAVSAFFSFFAQIYPSNFYRPIATIDSLYNLCDFRRKFYLDGRFGRNSNSHLL